MRARPVLFYIIGIAVFCAMDAVMKLLVESHSAVVATLWRYLSAIFFTTLIWIGSGRPRITREMLPVHVLRGGVIALSATLFFWALGILPLAQVVTIAFVAPLLIPPIASMVLKERMQQGSIVAGLVGFAGVLVAVGFDPASLSREKLMGVAAVLVSAMTYAFTVVLMRMRAAKDGPAVLSLLGALFPAMAILPLALLVGPAADIVPRGETWLWILLAGAFGAIALQFLARAYAQAEAQFLAPFEYTALVWAALFGWVFFSEPVSLRVWAGAAIIAGACLWQTRQQAPVAPGKPAA